MGEEGRQFGKVLDREENTFKDVRYWYHLMGVTFKCDLFHTRNIRIRPFDEIWEHDLGTF